jgi:hypothetical protein
MSDPAKPARDERKELAPERHPVDEAPRRTTRAWWVVVALVVAAGIVALVVRSRSGGG